MKAIDGCIDTPVDGAVIDSRYPVSVAGWAYGRGSPVAFVDAYLDDDRLGRAAAHGSRPDVAQALGDPAAERSGFTLTVPVTPGRRASVRFGILVTLADGSREWLGPVKVGLHFPVGGHIDVPDPGSMLDRSGFRVIGWAWAPTDRVSRVDLYLGNDWIGRAGLGRPRPDVAQGLGEPDAMLSGFDFQVVRTPAPLGDQSCLEAVVTLVSGAEEQLPIVPVRFDPGPVAASPLAPAGTGPPRRRRAPGSDIIRVLWSARGLDEGGSQLRMAELMARLQRDGRFRNTVLTPSDGPLRRALEAAGATVELRPGTPLDDAAGYGRAAAALAERMDGRFDLVVGFTITSFPAVDVANGLGIPSVLRIGESAPLPTVVGWLFGSLAPEVERRARWAVAGASAVVSNSHAALQTYRSDGYRGRFVVLVTGVDVHADRPRRGPDTRQEDRRALGIGPDERLLVCPASLWPVKGQSVLVTALSQVHSRYRRLSCALLGAADGGYAELIAEFAARSGLSDVVRILPFQADLGPWWRSADVVACVSESEALPAAVLEGMARGLPALGSRVGDLPRLIEPNVNGWLCDHSDLASMIGVLEEVAGAPPEVLRRMGDAALATVTRSYDRTQMFGRWIELLVSSAEGTTPSWIPPV